jgi:hypothetical protein
MSEIMRFTVYFDHDHGHKTYETGFSQRVDESSNQLILDKWTTDYSHHTYEKEKTYKLLKGLSYDRRGER